MKCDLNHLVNDYRGSGLERRLRERQKEKEADARDRTKEKEELEEIRRKLQEEGHPDPEGEMEKVWVLLFTIIVHVLNSPHC